MSRDTGRKSEYNECPNDIAPSREQPDGYRLRYICIWLVPMTLFSASAVLLAAGVVWLGPEQSPWSAVYAFGLAFVLLIVVLAMRGSAQQLRYRIGMGLFGGLVGSGGDYVPVSVDELCSHALKFKGGRRMPDVVGNGWSNVLRQHTTNGPRIHMRRMVGRVPGQTLTWYAGTSIAQVQRELKEANLQLVNVPSYGDVSLGAWVATIGHGMAGAAFSHGLISVRATVLHIPSGIVTDMGPELLLEKFGQGPEFARQFLVMTVTLQNSPTLVENSLMLRQARWVTTLKDAEWVLRKEAQVAVLFVGHRNTLALTWQKHAGNDVLGGGWVMDLGITMFAVVGFGLSDPRGDGRTEKLDKAPLFFHFYLSPIYIWSLLLLNLRNAEIFTTDLPLTPELTLNLTTALQGVYKKFNGRCEVRFLGQVTYIDIFCWSTSGARAIMSVLSEFGMETCALHAGKYQPPRDWFQCEGIKVVDACELVLNSKSIKK